ncbi:hypothetical protein E9993_06970 [Labilibacter sediminis]|nr:hypothetical protein E9993_06970 [Labilibacter sediminis]
MNTLKKIALAATAIMAMVACNSGSKTKTSETKEDKAPTEVATTLPAKTFDINILMQSALEGKTAAIQEALDNGFDPNTVDENKRTALMLASYNGHNEIAKILIANGADVNLTDTIHRTALMYASTGPFLPTVMTLLEAGAETNIQDNEEKWTAVMMAASEGQLEVIKALIAHGADLKMVDVDGESSWDFANSNGHKAVADYIKSQTK